MSLVDLWLPILVAAVFVFVVSSIVHMVLPIHKGDYGKLDAEAEVLAAMRTHGVGPGDYMFPCPASMKEMASPGMKEKFTQGPVGVMTIRPNGPPQIGKSLVQWFGYSIVVGIFVAYVASLLLEPGADSMLVFRATGAVAWLGYGVYALNDSIWKGVSWRVSSKFVFDGLLYGLATGAAFAWLWPGAQTA